MEILVAPAARIFSCRLLLLLFLLIILPILWLLYSSISTFFLCHIEKILVK